MVTQSEKAESFRSLHHQARPLILPNAWDVPSARSFEDAGFPAVATSSAGLMVSHGFRDGQEMPRKEFLRATGAIAKALDVPLSADIVAGYGRGSAGVAATVRQVLDVGAVGINLEDMDPARGTLVPVSVQVRKIQKVREVGDAAGVPIVINARTDAFRHAAQGARAGLEEAIRRAIRYRDAGADCLYPMGLTDGPAIEEFVRAVEFPTNVMVRKGLPPLVELERIGVKRISFGPSASYATMGFLRRIGEEVLKRGSFDLLLDGAISFEELNRLAIPRGSPPVP